ncbi:MAG: peptide-methionine (S)-S-oxide reductase MsrA [Gemmatimonadota bacterium]
MGTETATFGAGCFWGVEAEFRRIPGVVDVVCGYCGGTVADPSYEDVCTDRTGHAEVVQVVYDPARVSYEDLLQVFWRIHDPTSPNRQGGDVGTQYRSCIFVHSRQQAVTARATRNALEAARRFAAPIVTEILPPGPFYRAEERHQRYLDKRSQGRRLDRAVRPGREV